MRPQPRTDRPTRSDEPEHLRRIKVQKASWDELDQAKRHARLERFLRGVAELPPNSPAQRIATHNRAHVDEVVMMWLPARYKSSLFGDISHIIDLEHIEDLDRPFGEGIIIRTEQGPYMGRSFLENWREGIRLLGTGGGALDEHVQQGESRIASESGATLMARLLCVVDKTELRRLLEAVRMHDTKGTRPAIIDKLISEIKEGYREIDWDVPMGSAEDKQHQLQVIRRGLIVLNRFSERELRIIDESKKRASIYALDDRKDIIYASIHSDSPFMVEYVRDTFNTSAVIQKRSTGHAVIIFDKSKIPQEVASCVAQAIREEEAYAQGRTLPRNPSTLTAEGAVECASEWYFVHGNLLNGSESYPGTPATALTLKEITAIVEEVLASKANRIREWRREQKEKQQQQYKK